MLTQVRKSVEGVVFILGFFFTMELTSYPNYYCHQGRKTGLLKHTELSGHVIMCSDGCLWGQASHFETKGSLQ